MKINLMCPGRDTPGSYTYPDAHIIAKDLNLQLVFEQASRGGSDADKGHAAVEIKDDYIKDAMRKIMLTPLTDAEDILYRQKLVKDSVENEQFIEALYGVAVRAEKTVSEHFSGAGKLSKGAISTVEKIKYLGNLNSYLKEIKELLGGLKNRDAFREAFEDFYNEYNDEFAAATEEILEDLEFITSGGKLSVRTDSLTGLKTERFFIEELEVTEYRERKKPKSGAVAKVISAANSIINPDVRELKTETLIADAKSLEDAACDYILSFYEDFIKTTGTTLKNMKLSSAFLLGAARLYKRFERFNVPLCFPEICGRESIDFDDLCESCLCIYNRKKPVGNSVSAHGKQIFVITGANQGGKSTYLRSIGLAQVFMQAGMFVTAESYKSALYKNIFTHFTRREDSAMNSGRLDEELKRMSHIVDRLTSDSMMLLNESFATTTEKEGSVIAEELTDAVLKTEVRMFCVTHLLEFAHRCFEKNDERVLFLSAERRADGTRSFRIKVNPPEDTSYGLDLYDAIIR